MAQENFTIGQLAKTTAVNVETIRYYQRRGLLAEPVKPYKGIRRYTERDAQRVRFIKQGQKLGFSLDDLKELMSLEDEQQCLEARLQLLDRDHSRLRASLRRSIAGHHPTEAVSK